MTAGGSTGPDASGPVLTSSSGRVKAARRLTRRAGRTEHGLFLAEGPHTLGEALGAREDLAAAGDAAGDTGSLVEVFATRAATAAYDDLRVRAEARGVGWHLAEESAVASLSGTVSPPGLVGVCRSRDVALADLPAPAGPAAALAVCAEIRDPGNAGTVIRCADAAGATGVVLLGDSVDPYNDKAVRASAGSLFHLPLTLDADADAAVDAISRAGWTVLATAGDGEVDLFEAEESGLLDGPVAWLFGNEARGLPADLAARTQHRLRIPVLGRAESLNLATAAAVCLYASARRRTALSRLR